MKRNLLTLLFCCLSSIFVAFGASRYWVGGAAGNWSNTSCWSETSGGASGATVPTDEDDVIFDNSSSNANPTVTLTAAVTTKGFTFDNSNVVFAGAFSITTTNMEVNSCQVKFVNDVLVNSSLTFAGTTTVSRVIHAAPSSQVKKFQIGNGTEFALIGHSADNCFEGGTFTNYRFNTTTDLKVFIKSIQNSLGALSVDKGLITLSTDLTVVRLNLSASNSQELILAPNITFAINPGGSSTLGSAAHSGCVDASASGSKFVVKTGVPSVLDGTKRVFKANTTINCLEFNSSENTFVLYEPMRVRTLSLTAGTVDNSIHDITIVAGGEGVITGTGSTVKSVNYAESSTRYWVGGAVGEWNAAANWGTASGSMDTPGVPEFGDNVVFSTADSPTVTLSDLVVADNLRFEGSNVRFEGAFDITANSMIVNNSQLIFRDDVMVNNSLTFEGTDSHINQLSVTSGRAFKMGAGGAFTLTGNSVRNFFAGSNNAYYTLNTSSDLILFFNPTTVQTLGAIVVDKGRITLGNDVKASRLILNKTNGQELIVGENATFTIAGAGTSNFSNAANAGVIDAGANGSKVVVTAVHASVLETVGRIFKEGITINHLEFDSSDKTFVMGFPLTVKDLTLTAGVINNGGNDLTIATGGNVIKGAGSTAHPLIVGLPGVPSNIVATATNEQASVAFSVPQGDGGSEITNYIVTSIPGAFTASGSASPIEVTGLTNGVAYTFTVKAQNSVGDGAESAASNSATPTQSSSINQPQEGRTRVNVMDNCVEINLNSELAGRLVVKLISTNGQEMQTEVFAIAAGENTIRFAINCMMSGVYVLELNDGVSMNNYKVIIK